MQICHVAWKTAFVAGILKRLSEGGEFHHIQEKGHEPDIPKPDQSFINAHLSFRVNSNPEPRSCKTPEACENYVNRARHVLALCQICGFRTVEMPTRPCAYPLMTRSIRTVPA